MDSESVISLGHTFNVPLMCLPSDLSYRLEPHGLKQSVRGRSGSCSGSIDGSGEVYPGWSLAGYQEGSIPGTNPGSSHGQIEAYFQEYTN